MLAIIGRLLDRLFEKPLENGFLFLSVALALAALGVFGVRFVRSLRSKNGNGNGDELADYSKDLQGLGLPRPARQGGEPFIATGDSTIPAGPLRLVRTEVLDATVAGLNRDINRVSDEGRQLLERVVKVEGICGRTEVAVQELRQEFTTAIQAQTVEITGALSKQILAAFQALDKQADEKTDGVRKEPSA